MNANGQIPAIEVRGLYKQFGALEVLRGIDLRIAPNERFAIMGLSGSGKSVFVKHLIGLLSIDRGEVRIEGQSLADMDQQTREAYLRRIGVVFQQSALFDSMSTGDNVAFAMREHRFADEATIQARVEELLQSVGLEGSTDKMPSELSGGMQKRAGIARALALSPDYLFFDEPTSGLDPITGVKIEDLIMETHERFGYTGVVITHSVDTARKVADRMAILWKGQIRIQGTPDEVFASDDPLVRSFVEKDPKILEEL